MRRARVLAAGAVFVVVIAGCQGGHRATSADPTRAPAARGRGSTSSGSGSTPDTSVATTVGQRVGADLPPAATVNLQIAHPDGVTVHVTGIAFFEDNIQLTTTVVNGRSADVVLSYLDNDLYLTDDTGVRYRLSPPPGNPQVTVAARSTLQATLVFLGRISPKATTVTLTTNASRDDTSGADSASPTIQLTNIPVGQPGQSSGTPTTSTTSAAGAGSTSTSTATSAP